MRTVGIRELKNKLSAYLKDVRSGEIVLVTDRGRVIAEIRPPGMAPGLREGISPAYAALLRMIESGEVRPGYPVSMVAEVYDFPGVPLRSGTSRELLDEDREDKWPEKP